MYKEDVKISDLFFKQYRDEIAQRNRIQLGRICIMGGTMSFLLFLISLFFPALFVTRPIYLYGTAVAVICYTLSRKIPFVNVIFYLFFILSYIFAFQLAMFSKTFQSTATFCVFLVIMPTFIIDKRWRLYLFQTLIMIVFLVYISRQQSLLKEPVFLVDSLAFYLFGLLIYSSRLVQQVRSITVHEEMRQKVEIDVLTDLSTRGALEQCIDQYIFNCTEPAAFILLDIDNFKGINDNFGHKVGDELLHQTGAILKKEFRKSDYLGRLGGDEFVVFLPKLHNNSWLVNRLDKLVEELNRTFIGDEAVCEVSASIGVAMYPKDGVSFDELYRNADNAMYESKKGGKNKYTIFEQM